MRFTTFFLFLSHTVLWGQNSLFLTFPEQWQGNTDLFQQQSEGLKSAGNASSETIGLWQQFSEYEYPDMELRVRLDFALSTSNYLRWIIAADSLSPASKKILQVKWNAAEKNLLLQKINGSSTTTLIAGKPGRLAAGKETRVRIVFRNGTVALYSDTSAANNRLEKEGEASVPENPGSWRGLLFTHTATRADKLNLLEWQLLPKPLRVSQWRMPSSDSLFLTLSDLADTSALPEVIFPSDKTVKWKSEKDLLVVMTSPLNADVPAMLRIQGLVKKGESETVSDSVEIVWKRPWRYHELRITEIMPVPAEEEVEYIELFNTTRESLRLIRWKICDASSCAVIPDTVLLPGQFLVLSASEKYVHVPDFPSLNNSGDSLKLYTEEGILVDRIHYASQWWKGISQTGTSLELQDVYSVCEGSLMWIACSRGGTPGAENSQSLDSMEMELRIILEADLRLTVRCNVPMKVGAGNIQLDENWHPGIFSDAHTWKSLHPVNVDNTCSISFDSLNSCRRRDYRGISVVVLKRPSKGDLRITEILFNPVPYGKDFVEIENSTEKNLFIETILLSNGADTVLCVWNRPLGASDKIIWTEDSSLTQQQYPGCATNWWEADLPALADDAGTILLKTDSIFLDEIRYSDAFHSSLLEDKEGISLERIQFSGPDEYQWMSCATGAEPGCKPPTIVVEDKQSNLYCSTDILSPDGDGRDDLLILAWMGEDAIVKASLTIYSMSGMLRKKLLTHELWQHGQPIVWDGAGASGILPPDWYIVELQYENEKEIKKERKLVALIKP